VSEGYLGTAVTAEVRAAQQRYGGRARAVPSAVDEPRDALSSQERAFLAGRDGFYVATVSSTGWPYVQFRGGPVGFVRTPDEHTLTWPDFRGNRQLITTGNTAGDDRVALFFMDYPSRSRLKVYGRAEIIDARGVTDPALELLRDVYGAVVERLVTVTVVAFDWNCPQHITPRYSAEELARLREHTPRG
jgi:predicted pyridoxine 5'-phosphate oxidase superfamily flavin-nucleotide-binding protein